jgi:hypothetical protein
MESLLKKCAAWRTICCDSITDEKLPSLCSIGFEIHEGWRAPACKQNASDALSWDFGYEFQPLYQNPA